MIIDIHSMYFLKYLPYIYLSPHSLSVISDMTEDIRYQTSDMTEDILNQYYCSSILYFEKSGLSPALVGQLQQIIRPIIAKPVAAYCATDSWEIAMMPALWRNLNSWPM